MSDKKQSLNRLSAMRHSAEHVLHQAMKDLYPKIHLAMGPATDEGFYFDFDPSASSGSGYKISESDFPKIEKRMQEIIDLDLPITKMEVSEKEARNLFKGNPYKLEWIDDIVRKDEKITVYWTGKKGEKNSMVDLCSGPHVESTGKVGHFKLLSIAGAYWHGDEKNKMLTRIYGTAFFTQKELDNFLYVREEAKKRDHRKLGKELDLFVISDSIGKGLPLLTPKGTIIRKEILNYEYELEIENGFQHVTCPHIASSEIYKRTGHWEHYKDVMYAPFGIDGEEYVLKPMNCPHHYMIFESRPRSYRELPYRVAEPGTCYRYEKSGELSGLMRVRALSIDDSHILMSEDQIESEFARCIKMVAKMFEAFGLKEYYVRLSLADPSDAVKYIADSKTWQKAGKLLEKIIKDNKLKYVKAQGEASFYGPKIDYMVKDSLGREWQMSTLQLDLFMGKRLNLVYTDKNGKEQHPVILHRGLTGSIERTLGILIEHYAGAFPVWLAPVQVKIIPISSNHAIYAQEIAQELRKNNIRIEIDDRSDTMQAKIRDSQMQKLPYMMILGDREVKENKVSLRLRNGNKLNGVSLGEFISRIKGEISGKKDQN